MPSSSISRTGSSTSSVRSPVQDWVQFQAETGAYDVTIERDENSARRQGPPKLYRYELQGPTAGQLVEQLTGAPLPDVAFFGMTDFTIAGHHVRALRHGMAGQPGFELFGPWEEGPDVLAALLGRGPGSARRAGARAYSTANLESGWIPRPPAAIFGEGEKAFREWLPAAAVGSLGGSMNSAEITDYYVTPSDIGYGRLVRFDHDFLGRDALQEIEGTGRREKVTLVWNPDDVAGVMRSQHEPGLPAKFMEMPKSRYATCQADTVLRDGPPVRHFDGRRVHRQRALDGLARNGRPRRRRAGNGGHDPVGRGAEHPQARRRASSPGRDPRDCRTGSVCASGPRVVPRRAEASTDSLRVAAHSSVGLSTLRRAPRDRARSPGQRRVRIETHRQRLRDVFADGHQVFPSSPCNGASTETVRTELRAAWSRGHRDDVDDDQVRVVPSAARSDNRGE